MLDVHGVTVRYGDTVAVEGATLAVPDGSVTAILGPSGSGKTSLLRAVAGLESLAAGTIGWDGDDLTTVPPHRRGFGLMFQDHALFGHLDAEANVRFGLRVRGVPAAEQHRRAAEMLELVGLGSLASRRIDELSGGEQQRVALARALAPNPRLLMLDEPLASVDRERREQLAAELHRVVRATGTATLLVTHDLDEAFTLADRVVVLDRGTIVQEGTAPDVWRLPATPAVARFLGVATEFELPVRDGAAVTPWGAVPVPPHAHHVWVGWRPSDVVVAATGPVTGTAVASWFRRDHFVVDVATAVGTVTGRAAEPVAVGTLVGLTAALDAAVILPA